MFDHHHHHHQPQPKSKKNESESLTVKYVSRLSDLYVSRIQRNNELCNFSEIQIIMRVYQRSRNKTWAIFFLNITWSIITVHDDGGALQLWTDDKSERRRNCEFDYGIATIFFLYRYTFRLSMGRWILLSSCLRL
jgi:hypothetical protein